MTRFTAKSAEAARKMAAAIMPNAEPEKKNGFVVGLGKSQNRFFADEVSGNSYCEAYADDCETLTHINIFNDCNDVVATIEIGESDTAIDEIRKALGIENVAAKVDVADYAVSVEAQEVAVNAEIENAGKANAAADFSTIKVKSAEDVTKLIQMTMSNVITCQSVKNGAVLSNNENKVRLEFDDKVNFEDYEYTMYAEEIHRKLDLSPAIRFELGDYDTSCGEKSVTNVLVKVNGLDVIYYGYGFGPDFHEYDEKLLHINVDRDKHSLTDSKYDEFKTYKSKKKMNTALARYGLNFEQVEQFFANEQSKMDCENEKIHAFIADALNMGDAERGKKIKLIPQKDLGKSYVMLTARDVASRDFDYRKMCDGEYHIRTCRKWSFTLSSVAVYETEQQAHEVVKMLGVAIQRGEEYFTFPEVEEVTTPAEEKNPLKAKILAAELAAENAHKERENFFKNLYLKMCGDYYIATGFVQYVTDYAKVVYRKDGDKYIEDAAAFAELKAMENKMKELYHKAHELNNIAAKVEKSNAEIIACIDDYLVNADAAAQVEIENEMNNRLAEENKRHNFIANVLNMGEMESGKKILLIPNADFGFSEALLTARKVAFRDFDYLKTNDGNYHVEICRNGHYTRSTVAIYETEGQVQEVIKMLGAAIQRGKKVFTLPTVAEVKKLAEIKKSCIDWTDAIFQNVTVPEIFKAQKELKKFLKLGQIELAENIFAMLKTLCKNYREQFAA